MGCRTLGCLSSECPSHKFCPQIGPWYSDPCLVFVSRFLLQIWRPLARTRDHCCSFWDLGRLTERFLISSGFSGYRVRLWSIKTQSNIARVSGIVESLQVRFRLSSRLVFLGLAEFFSRCIQMGETHHRNGRSIVHNGLWGLLNRGSGRSAIGFG